MKKRFHGDIETDFKELSDDLMFYAMRLENSFYWEDKKPYFDKIKALNKRLNDLIKEYDDCYED